MRTKLFVAVSAMLLLVAAGARSDRHDSSSVRDDPSAGRRLFITTGCAACHRVSCDSGLPAADGHGPFLHDMGQRPATEIGALIIARSPTGELWLEASECGMSGSTARLTLADVRSIALYLQTSAR